MEKSNREEALGRNSIEQKKENRQYRDLERRYITKRGNLEKTIERAISDREFAAEIIESIQKREREIKRIDREISDFKTRITEEIQSEFTEIIERERREIKNLQKSIRASFNREMAYVDDLIKSNGISYHDIPRRTKEEFKFVKDLEAERIERIRKKRSEIKNEINEEFRGKIKLIESKINDIEREEENLEESVRREFDREIKTNARRLPEGIKKLLEAQRVGNDFKNAKLEEDRYRRAKKLFNKRTWKK